MTELSQKPEFGSRPEDLADVIDLLEDLSNHNNRFTQDGVAADILGVDAQEYTKRQPGDTEKVQAWMMDPDRITLQDLQELERHALYESNKETLANAGMALGSIHPEDAVTTIHGEETLGSVYLQLTNGFAFNALLRYAAKQDEVPFDILASSLVGHVLCEASYHIYFDTGHPSAEELLTYIDDTYATLQEFNSDQDVLAIAGALYKHKQTDTVREWWVAAKQGLFLPPEMQAEYEMSAPATWHTLDAHHMELNWALTLDMIESARSKPLGQALYQQMIASAGRCFEYSYEAWLKSMETEYGSEHGYDDRLGEIFANVRERVNAIRSTENPEATS